MQQQTLAQQLGALYKQRAAAEHAQWCNEQDIAARTLAVTPEDGWPGKNQEARDVARDRALATDTAIVAMRKSARELAAELSDIEADIEALEAERREYEWNVRARHVACQERLGVAPDDGRRGDGASWDDDPGGVTDAEMAELRSVYGSEPYDAGSDDDIPF